MEKKINSIKKYPIKEEILMIIGDYVKITSDKKSVYGEAAHGYYRSERRNKGT